VTSNHAPIINHSAEFFTQIASFDPLHLATRWLVVFILQMRKLRHREIKVTGIDS
jgi:hypothetical protein